MKINIVSVWTWFSNILDTQTLSSSEQLILVHLIKILNRNFWQPTKISVSALCRSSGKDSRTVKRSLSMLKNSELIEETEKGIFLKFKEEKERGKTAGGKKTSSRPSPSKAREELKEWREERSKDDQLIPGKLERELQAGMLSDESKKLLKSLSPEMQKKITEKYRGIELNF